MLHLRQKGKTVCTPHHIREFELKAVVLEDLRRVTHFARMKEKQFAAYISSKNTLELRREMNTIQKIWIPCGGAERNCPSCSSGSMRTMCWGG
ncbi:MAG: hypothetical protein ACLUS6_06470 [Dysosmobacter sp.]